MIEIIKEFHDKNGYTQQPFPTKLSAYAVRTLHYAAKDMLMSAKALLDSCKNQIKDSPEQIALLRSHLMIEELGETIEALAHCDKIGVLDGMADTLYVVGGTAIVYNLPMEQAFYVVHKSNMTKERQATDADGMRIRDKGPKYQPPDLVQLLLDNAKDDK